MGPPGSVHSASKVRSEPSSPLKRRKTNESKSLDVPVGLDQDLTGSLPSISPSLSFLNLHSPVTGGRLSFSASGDAATPFDYAALLGLSEHDLNSTLLSFDGQTSIRPKSSASNGPFLHGLVKQPSNTSDQHHSNKLQIVLLRYFIEVLAKWFDLCDPEKHFELVVPQRARYCAPLMNAICTASARHLTRIQKYRDASGDIIWDGQRLPELKAETAFHYHNECIKDLIKMSMDPEQIPDENLLAAAIILRFYEEVDSPLREDGDNELFLRVTSTFINAQAPEIPSLPHSSPEIHQPSIPLGLDSSLPITSPSSTSQPTPPATSSGMVHTPTFSSTSTTTTTSHLAPRPTRHDGLRQAAFWVGFRQEIHSAFMKQRPFSMPLSRCDAFRSFTPAEDAVWADRLIIFCADVLDFCYGSGPSTAERWRQLKRQEHAWSRVLPSTFEPIYFEEPPASPDTPLAVFPQIWHLADCHVAGLQHVELARILLAVYDPTRPKLGPGHVAGLKALTVELKAAVLRLCGMALSNRRTPPGLVTAAMGITMCGEHFEDRLEQMALLAVLDELESQHAWPAGQARDALIREWGWHVE